AIGGAERPIDDLQTGASGKAAERHGKPVEDLTEVVEGDYSCALRGDRKVALGARRRREQDLGGINQHAGDLASGALGATVLAVYHQHRIGGPQGQKQPTSQETKSRKSVVQSSQGKVDELTQY